MASLWKMAGAALLLCAALALAACMAEPGGVAPPFAGVPAPSLAMAAPCLDCHAQVSEVLPKGHQAIKSAALASCVECHSPKGKAAPLGVALHLAHYRLDDFGGDCFSCHALDAGGGFGLKDRKISESLGAPPKERIAKMAPYYRSWSTSKFMDQRHAQEKVSCTACHGKPFPKRRVGLKGCLACHQSYEKVAALTADVKPNPHDSPHYEDLRCTLCHKAHKPSVLYCSQCHEFDLKTP